MGDYFPKAMQAAFTWGTNSDTYEMTLKALANNSAVYGGKCDLGENYEQEYAVFLLTQYATAPTVNTMQRLFLAWSRDNSAFDGAHPGTNSAATTTNLIQIPMEFNLVLRAVTTYQQSSWTIVPRSRYVAPALWNDGTGQALANVDAQHQIAIVPARLLRATT